MCVWVLERVRNRVRNERTRVRERNEGTAWMSELLIEEIYY